MKFGGRRLDPDNPFGVQDKAGRLRQTQARYPLLRGIAKDAVLQFNNTVGLI